MNMDPEVEYSYNRKAICKAKLKLLINKSNLNKFEELVSIILIGEDWIVRFINTFVYRISFEISSKLFAQIPLINVMVYTTSIFSVLISHYLSNYVSLITTSILAVSSVELLNTVLNYFHIIFISKL